MGQQTSAAAQPDAEEQAIETIADTMELLERPAHWVRGIEAADANGRECKAGRPEATCFCLYAAMRHAAGTTGSNEDALKTPGLRDVHDAIERRLWANGETVKYHKTSPNPGVLLVSWNDEPELCEHGDVLEVLADAAIAIRIRGRALAHDEKPQTRLESTGNAALDEALWALVATLSDEGDGNSELIDAGEEVLRAWQRWQTEFN